jgi:oligoendopeptidase F
MKKPAKKPVMPTIWDLKKIYKSDTDPQIEKDLAECKKVVGKFVANWKENNKYLSDSTTLKKALDEYDYLSHHFGLSKGYGYYLSLRLSQEENNPKLKAQATKLKDHAVHLANEIDFFTIRLSKIPTTIQKKLLASSELKTYHHFLVKLFEQASHILTEPEERIMSLKNSTSYGSWIDLTSNLLAEETALVADDTGKKKTASLSELMSLISSQKKKVRDGAASETHRLFKTYARIAEHELNALLDNKKVNDDLRDYTRPDQSRHMADDMNSTVVDTMTKVVADNFDIAQKYYKLKAKLFKTPKLAYHERSVAYGKIDKKISYEDTVSLVGKVLTELDSEFGQIFDRFTREGHIDVYPKQNRTSGAFCAHDLPTLPTYILLNHTGRLNDALTLAHEVGHGINNELIRNKQKAVYFETPLSTAEVASTFMEDFVLKEIASTADEETRLALMLAKLNDDISTIFRQVACYRFEQELHDTFRKEGYLSKEKIGQIFKKNMSAYMGPAVSQDTGSENWWVYWSHIRNHFYVYSYASGLLISKAMQNKLAGDKSFMDKVKYFLSAGTSDSPKNIFNAIGIDIEQEKFWQHGIAEVRTLLSETEKLAKKLKKI